MERKIGEIFQYNGEWYQCVEGTGCYKCDFNIDENTCIADDPHCTCRSDKKDVIFKKLEKVGEPYISSRNKKRYQLYRFFCLPITKDMRIEIGGTNCVGIEIKQNKENMEEEREYTEDEFKNSLRFQHHKNIEQVINMKKMKEFDINLAKQGKPVCTRDGRKARIICFDTKGDVCPIIALVEENGIESAYHYDKNGKNAYKKSELDLMMFPMKCTGYINIYDNNRVCKQIFETEGKAKIAANSTPDKYIKTIKIEWEE